MPSLLKSATALTLHPDRPFTTKPPPFILVPSISHTTRSPVVVFCHNMSLLPLPSKSPIPLNTHSFGKPRWA
ncbi:hypothetical protein MBAV_004342 [Candidatus Magnetobacterium bavaricum]|uniref:Uncharacterized protein n=1 Tax=Candidatus Magnetobacterium bavaricum TaxID=29290 RepID=A0A0F3GNK1_9BACT|nr:hypothetical protein MBAV_004342 [Candidatus Magnetobacterium bavaricum]